MILKVMDFDVSTFYNIIGIGKGFEVEIKRHCNFTMHLGLFLNFFFSYPGGLKRTVKYVFVCILLLFLIQIFRVISFVVCIKYFPQYWDSFHDHSTYLYYYPLTLFLWYKYSEKIDV